VGCSSCRTDQLGNKITTGISHQLKNQAINKTESFVNNKANTFLNAFGAGRSEVSIGGILLNYWESSTEKALKENVIKRLNARKRLN
jgi:hypothetical protein